MDDIKLFCDKKDVYRDVEREYMEEYDCRPKVCYRNPSHFWDIWDVAGSVAGIFKEVQNGEYNPQNHEWLEVGRFPLIKE